MMTLDGWDTVTLCDVALVNQAMIRRQNEFITRFDFKQGKLHFDGKFGPWQIKEGGSLQTMIVEIPIETGQLRGLPKRRRPLAVTGILLQVKLKLRLLPSQSDEDSQELVFDLDADHTVGADEPVLPIDVKDPRGILTEVQRRLLAVVAADCLSAHADQVTFVFASTKTRGTTDVAALATPYKDWCNVVTADGRQYLGLFGSISEPKGRVDRVDPALIKQVGSAYLAISNRMFHTRFLEPTLTRDFRPKTKFKASEKEVINAHPIRLPDQDKGMITIRPIIDRLRLFLTPGSLRCSVVARGETALFTFHITIEMTMRFAFNAKTGVMRFLPDPHPVIKHSAHLPQPFDTLIGWLVRLFVGFFERPITNLIRGIALKMQQFNTPDVQTTTWTGIRDFKTCNAQTEGCLWLCDTRPAEAEQFVTSTAA